MRRALAGLLLLLFIPGALAGTIGMTLSVGESIRVNGIKITLVDVSSDGRAAITIGNDSYVLQFGEEVNVGKLSVLLGSVFPSRSEARIFISGKEPLLAVTQSRIEVGSEIRTLVLSPGQEVGIAVEVKNLGEDSYVPLSVKAPRNWQASLRLGDTEVLGVYLHHGESLSLTLYLKAGREPGRYAVWINAGDSRVRINAIVRGDAMKAYVDFPGKEVEAGDNVSFTLHLSSSTPIEVSLTGEAPPGWDVKFMAPNSAVKVVRVSGERTLNVLVSVPTNASVGLHTLTIRAGNLSVPLRIYVTKTHAGEKGRLILRVVDPETGSYVAGAEVRLFGNGINESAVTLPDGTASLSAPGGTYRLEVSKEAYKGVEREVKITAGREESVTVSLKKLPYYFDFIVTSPSKSQPLGNNFVYEAILRNLGKEGDTYSIELKIPENWGGLVVENPNSKIGVGSIYLNAGEEKRVYVVLIPPDTARIANYTAEVRVRSIGSGLEKEKKLIASLVGSYGMTLTPERYSLKAKAGKESSIRVRIYNTGTSPLTNVRVKVDAPKGWEVKVSPKRVATLERDSFATFEIEIKVPASADAGDYQVKLEGVSDQRESTETLRVTVSKGSSATYVGAGMVLLAGVLLIFVLMRYGRR